MVEAQITDKIEIKPETITAIKRVLKRGYVAEVKLEKGKVAVIQIQRQLIEKTEISDSAQ